MGDGDENGEKVQALEDAPQRAWRGSTAPGSVTESRAVADSYTDDIAFSVFTAAPTLYLLAVQHCTSVAPHKGKGGNPDARNSCACVQAVKRARQ